MSEYVAQRVVGKSKTITLKELPFDVGTMIEIRARESTPSEPKKRPTVKELLESGLIGIWADREDIGDTLEYARTLREEAWRPRYSVDDTD